MTLHLTAFRATALAVTAHATDAADARLLLEALGLVAPVVVSQPLPSHVRGHDGRRACYMRGCRLPQCCRANARYVRQWRAKGGCRRVTPSARLRFVELAARAGRGRRAAYPGQLALDVKETA